MLRIKSPKSKTRLRKLLNLLLAVIVAALMAAAYTPLMMMLFTGLFITVPFSIATVCLAAVEIIGVFVLIQLIAPNERR